MMEKERCCDEEKAGDDVVLPGFRFHPTDEELVGFYLKKKIMQKPLSIELIRQLDIYKYDPWDLPKLATTGEKEWYFYCPRDRKYRNSVRPNRVTSAGFWKATGTDRPIYSSEGGRCIGLKKSLVFYRGRAAKGIKTDWMMHEFRLPSTTDVKRPLDKNIPPNDSWAICRIFKKTCSMAQRALSHSCAAQLPEPAASEMFSASSNTAINVQASAGCTVQLNGVSCADLPSSFYFSPATDMASILMNLPPPLVLGDLIGKASATIEFSQRGSCTTVGFPEEITKSTGVSQSDDSRYWLVNPSYDVTPNLSEQWRASSQWESMPCPSEMSASYMAKCYT